MQRPFDIDRAVSLIRIAVEPYPKAAITRPRKDPKDTGASGQVFL